MYRIVKNLINTKGSIPTGMDSSNTTKISEIIYKVPSLRGWIVLETTRKRCVNRGSIPTGMDSSVSLHLYFFIIPFHPYGDG